VEGGVGPAIKTPLAALSFVQLLSEPVVSSGDWRLYDDRAQSATALIRHMPKEVLYVE